MDLDELAEKTHDENSFLEFVRALIADRESAVAAEKLKPSCPYGLDAGGWNNSSIEQYLECAAAWAKDSSFGDTQMLKGANPWKKFAWFLLMGKVYE